MYSGPDNSKMYTLGGSNLCNVLQSVLVCKCTGSVPATPPAAGAKAAAGGASSTAAGVAASPSRRSSTACNAMAVLEWAARFLHADLGRHYDVQKALLTADAEAFGVKGRENIAKINGELLADSEKT
eukprot:gene6827-3694_t